MTEQGERSAQRVTRLGAADLRVPAPGDAAKELADLVSRRKDLIEAREYAEKLAQMPADTHNTDHDRVLRDALWKAVAISYRRAFTSGASFATGKSRAKIPAEHVDGLTDEDKQVHSKLRQEADKHVAHRVDDAREQGSVIAVLAAPPARTVSGLELEMYRFGGAQDELVLAVPDLCTRIIEALAQSIDDLNAIAWGDAQERVDALYEAAGLDDMGDC